MTRNKLYYLLIAVLFGTISGCSRGYDEPLKIAYQRGTLGIWLINEDGSEEKQLTSDVTDVSPSWSPDGLSIVFARNSDVYKMNSDGTDLHRLTFSANCYVPTWSPDQQQICYRAGTANIFRIKSDGTTIVPIQISFSGFNYPSWSPDGSRIAVLDSSINVNFINAVILTAAPTALTITGGCASIACSPDGSKIAYTYLGQIYIINSDGTGNNQVSSGGGVNTSPSWSPDGKKIVFSNDFSGPPLLFIMNSDGSGKRQLTFGSTMCLTPCFEGKPR